MRRRALLLAAAILAAACTDAVDETRWEATVVAEGLTNPVGLALLPSGGLLVAEEGTGLDDLSAGVAMVSNGRVDRIVTGLPSGRDSGDLSGVPLVAVAPDGSTVYTGHFGSDGLLTFAPLSPKAIDAGVVLGPDDLDRRMAPLNAVRLENPFDLAFSADGVPVVTDASGNGVATETSDGRTEFIHRFDQLATPGPESLTVEAVPTGIARLGDEYLVTLTGGCPYPREVGQLVAIDGNQGVRVVVDRLNMPIDVTVDDEGTIWVLEFARFTEGASCFDGSGYAAGTGRLSRLEGDRLVTVVDGLDNPGSVVAAPDGSLYVTEIFRGRVLRLVEAGTADATVVAAPPAGPWSFADVAADVGIDFVHGSFATGVSNDPVAMMGGGVCWLDAEGDGDLDVYFVNSHAVAEADRWQAGDGLPTSRLYRNDGGRFADVTASTGTGLAVRGNGCVATDLDRDGDIDLYVTADGPNALLVNDGSGNFTDQASAAGVDTSGWSSTAVAGDVDGDGFVDLFVGTYIDLERKIDKPSGAFPQDYVGIPNALYLNNGDGTFRDVAAAAGLATDDRTLGALLSDLDQDGDLDLYVANDGQQNALYENLSSPGDIRFADITGRAAVGDSGSGMGVGGGDYDGDGIADLMVTNWEAELHAVYRSTERRLEYRYSTHRIGTAGLGNGRTGWGTAWADFDNDTDLDLLIVNGRVPVTDPAADAEPIQLLGNLGAEGEPGQLRDWSERTGLEAVGPRLARGAAVADFDDDGDLDIAINQIAGAATLLVNETPPGRALTVVADPAVPGTVATATLGDGTTLRRELHAGSSYLSSSDPRFHFGLGSSEAVAVEVTWPDGSTSSVEDIDPSGTVVVRPDS